MGKYMYRYYKKISIVNVVWFLLYSFMSIGYAQTGSGILLHHGQVIRTWGNQTVRYDIKSATKTIAGATLLGIALQSGIVDLDAQATQYYSAIDSRITLKQLAHMSAGYPKAGGIYPLLFIPGTMWNYSDGNANWACDVLTTVFRRDLKGVLWHSVLKKIGVRMVDWTYRQNIYRPHRLQGIERRECGSGLTMTVRGMARVGQFFLQEGWWNGEQLLFPGFVENMHRRYPKLPVHPTSQVRFPGAGTHYGLFVWTNQDGWIAGVPRDAFWAWGLGDTIILVIPSQDLVAVRAGPTLQTGNIANASRVRPFFLAMLAEVQ